MHGPGATYGRAQGGLGRAYMLPYVPPSGIWAGGVLLPPSSRVHRLPPRPGYTPHTAHCPCNTADTLGSEALIALGPASKKGRNPSPEKARGP